MEYRKKIEQLSERKSKNASSVTPSVSGSSDKIQSTAEPEAACRFSFPPDFPDALKGSRTMAFMEALRQEGFLDAEYRPQERCNATLMAFIADSIATICNIRRQWKIFGDYWHLNNMRQLLDAKNRRGSKADKEDVVIGIFRKVAEADAKNRRGSKADKEDVVIGIFRKVAEADDYIRETNAYRSWVKSTQN